MRTFFPFVVFALIAACFYTGFKLAKNQETQKPLRQVVVTPLPEVRYEVRPQEDYPNEDAGGEPGDGLDAEDLLPEAMQPSFDRERLTPPEAAFSARSRQRFITLIDANRREVEVEILSVTDEVVKARRVADFRAVDIPVDVLSDLDRAFVDYLNGRRSGTPSSTR